MAKLIFSSLLVLLHLGEGLRGIIEAVNEPKREEMELQERGKGEQRNVNVAMCISCRLMKEHTQRQLLSPPSVSRVDL